MPKHHPALGALSFGISTMKTATKAKPATLKTVTVKFTPDQLLRLGDAAAIIGNGVTVEELIVAGAMHGIDCEADVLEDAIEGTLSCVEHYARQRRTVPDVKRTRHPLGCQTRQQLQAEQHRWAQENPGRIVARQNSEMEASHA